MSQTDGSTVSARALTIISCVAFIPIGIATVLLGPMLPSLSARWSLNYSQAGALFTAQYIASTCAVALSGAIVSWKGFQFAIKCGLVLIAVGLALLLTGPRMLGIACIAVYGTGLGIAVPAANLLVAEVNVDHRSAALNWLNFSWSAGAVSCPFLVAAAVRAQAIPFFLRSSAVLSIVVAIGMTFMSTHSRNAAFTSGKKWIDLPSMRSKLSALFGLAMLFFLYVGTENAFGGWAASYAKTLNALTPAEALITPSFFYAALMIGRLVAPFLLKSLDEVRLVRGGLLLACLGVAGMLASHSTGTVLISASVAGLGLSSVYPITIALLSREFGSASSGLGSVMFVLSNIGGGLLPWMVGVWSNRSGSLKTGLLLPLFGCALMLGFYFQNWVSKKREQTAVTSPSSVE
jgi:MFS transporter, FHS family, glucose/mannose:H+ symporter